MHVSFFAVQHTAHAHRILYITWGCRMHLPSVYCYLVFATTLRFISHTLYTIHYTLYTPYFLQAKRRVLSAPLSLCVCIYIYMYVYTPCIMHYTKVICTLSSIQLNLASRAPNTPSCMQLTNRGIIPKKARRVPYTQMYTTRGIIPKLSHKGA
jgi:hypothetical protein